MDLDFSKGVKIVLTKLVASYHDLQAKDEYIHF